MAAAGDVTAAVAAQPTGALPSEDMEFGFERAEMGREALAGTIEGVFHRHLFLCYESPDAWPSRLEAAEGETLPRLLSSAIKERRSDFKRKTRLTICEAKDGSDSSNGDVFIFPDMIRYRGLTNSNVENFVELLIEDSTWPSGTVEILRGSYVFVCAHGSRDKRCGVCGPALITKFKEEIFARGLEGQIFVGPCSHVGGHKYAGNAIIFSPNSNGEVTGHWYGYVTPDDVSVLIERHIRKGEIVEHLWRGQMGLSEEEQSQAQQLRLQLNVEANGPHSNPVNGLEGIDGNSGCCQGAASGNFTCCQNIGKAENGEENNHKQADIGTQNINHKGREGREAGCSGFLNRFKNWEREDTYTTIAVVTAVAAVAVAYSFYKHTR